MGNFERSLLNTHRNTYSHQLEQFLAAITPSNPQRFRFKLKRSHFKPQLLHFKLKNSRFKPQHSHLEPQTSNRWGKKTYTNSINDCNTSLDKDAMNRVSTRWPICRILLVNWY